MDNTRVGILLEEGKNLLRISAGDLAQKLSQDHVVDLCEVELNQVHQANSYDLVVILVEGMEGLKRLSQSNPADKLTITAYSLSREETDDPRVLHYIRVLEDKKFNPVYPDNQTAAEVYPSLDKITDATFCKRMKTKYVSHRLADQIDWNTDEFRRIREVFARVSRFLKLHDLNPSSRDGFIAVRGADGIYITASSTNKYALPDDRIVRVTNYVDHENAVYWEGFHKPSSETPCAELVFRQFQDLNILVHFHHKAFTYDGLLEPYRSSEYIKYGTLAEAEALVAQFSKSKGFAILRGHGEFMGVAHLDELEAKLRLLNNIQLQNV